MGLFGKKRVRSLDTPKELREVVDTIEDHDYTQNITFSAAVTVEELLFFAQALMEAKKRYLETVNR